MKITIRNTGMKSVSRLASALSARVRDAFGDFVERIQHVIVHLADTNGPKGGPDKRCVMLVRLSDGRVVKMHASGTDAWLVVNEAVSRALFQVRRKLERERSSRRAWTRASLPELQA